jgi:hypothetical protein
MMQQNLSKYIDTLQKEYIDTGDMLRITHTLVHGTQLNIEDNNLENQSHENSISVPVHFSCSLHLNEVHNFHVSLFCRLDWLFVSLHERHRLLHNCISVIQQKYLNRNENSFDILNVIGSAEELEGALQRLQNVEKQLEQNKLQYQQQTNQLLNVNKQTLETNHFDYFHIHAHSNIHFDVGFCLCVL